MMIIIALPFLGSIFSQQKQAETSNLCNIHAYACINLGWLKAKVTKAGVRQKNKNETTKQKAKRTINIRRVRVKALRTMLPTRKDSK